MGEIINLKTVHDYNTLLGIETLHPLVGIVDFSKLETLRHVRKNFGFYAVFYKELDCGEVSYGRSKYDYQEGTLIFVGPGQVAGADDGGETRDPKGLALLFHQDLLDGTQLARSIREYGFFSYESNEALHISERERNIILNCFRDINDELVRTADKYSKRIITANIEVMLNHCVRFYDRQFVSREKANQDVLVRFEELLGSYFDSEQLESMGLPSVRYCAEKLHFSPNYFGDLIKKSTGKSAQEYIQLTVIGLAKRLLSESVKSVSEIAYELGFKYPHHLSRMFKKVVGVTPNEYRSLI